MTRKEAAVAYFKVLFKHLHGRTGESYKNLFPLYGLKFKIRASKM